MPNKFTMSYATRMHLDAREAKFAAQQHGSAKSPDPTPKTKEAKANADTKAASSAGNVRSSGSYRNRQGGKGR